MTAGSGYSKASVTVPSDVWEQVRERAPRGQVSAYVTAALRRQLELDNLSALVDEMTERVGPVDEERVTRYLEEMR